MARKLTYEHPPGSGQSGCERVFNNDVILDTNRGKLRADQIKVGDYVQTTPRHKTKILFIESVVE